MTREKIRCQGSVSVGVIGSQALGRGLFLYPARIAEKITGLMDKNRPRQGQEIGPLTIRKGLELFTQGCQGKQIAWLTASRQVTTSCRVSSSRSCPISSASITFRVDRSVPMVCQPLALNASGLTD